MPAARKDRWLCLFALAWAGACTSGLVMRAPDAPANPRQLAVMEANVEISVLSDNRLQPRDDWSRAAQANIDLAVRARARANGARLVDEHAFDEGEYTRFYRWAYRSLAQIAARVEGRAWRDVKSVTQWRYDRSLESWPTTLGGAESVLLVWFRDAHAGADQVISNLLSPVQVHARQVGVACVLNMESRRIVWCEHQSKAFGDLRTPGSAKDAVDHLVAKFLPR